MNLELVMNLFAVLFFVTGLCLGSFFNVLIWRLPRGESLMMPPSHCPNCNTNIRWYQNIPVLSWIFLRGRCASCKVPISLRYPFVELVGGFLALLLWLRLGQSLVLDDNGVLLNTKLLLGMIFLLLLLPVSIIDIEHLIIPDSISLGGLGIALILACFGLLPALISAGLGILAGGGILFFVGWVGGMIMKKEAMGGGDIKLMAAAGAFFGWKIALLSIALGSFVGAFISLALIGLRVTKKEDMIPFGPFLALGIWISALWGDEIIRLYANLVLN